MEKILTPEQIKYALRNTNVTTVSKECGVGYNSCHKLSTYDGEWDYNIRTLKKISKYLLEEYEKLGKVYGLNKF